LPARLASIINKLKADAAINAFSAITDVIGGFKNILKIGLRKSFGKKTIKKTIKNQGLFDASTTVSKISREGKFSKFSSYLVPIRQIAKQRDFDGKTLEEILNKAGEQVWEYLNNQSPEQIEKIFQKLPTQQIKAVEYLKDIVNGAGCDNFASLRPKALAAGMSASNIDAAIAKLCTIPNASTRQAINTELTSYTNAEVRAFFEDLLVGNSDKHLGRNAPKIDAGIVQAWKVVKDARRDDANYRIDFELLKMTAIFRNHPQEGNKLLNFVGGDVGLKEILKENEKMPCHTCNNNTKRAYLSKADSMMIHLGYFVRNHQSTAGANRVIKQLKREKAESWHTDIPGIWTVEGAAFVLRTVYDGKYTTDITEFEKPTPTDADGKFAIADIYKNGVYIDCKSWAITQEGYTDSFDELIAGRGSYPQFLKYLKAIISLDKLEYWFDAKKTPKLDDVKKKWQQLFQSNKQNEIFETIWQNARLRGDLFGNRLEPAARTYFTNTLIPDLKSDLYQFINVK
jgi:hypothetical protein